MSKNITQIQAMWEKESNSYKTQEVGSGTQRFVREILECEGLFNLREGNLSTPKEKRLNEFIYEKKTKDRRHADFVLYINSDIIIPIEVEQFTHLKRGEHQLVNYQSDLEKKYGILTDGYEWRFYNNTLYRTFNISQILKEISLFTEYWKEYIKPEHYYISFFEKQGQLSFFGKEELDVEGNRQLFFEDITTLIKSLRTKFNIEGYFEELDKKEAEKKATEITYAYLIQFILYKTLADNKFENFYTDYQERLETIHRSIKSSSYKEILGIIDGMSSQISENIYHPFAEEQEYIWNKLLRLIHNARNELNEVSPWLDIIVFIKKYSFINVRNEIFGYVYENYLKELYEEEKKGQYFTDPAVVNFMLEQVGYTAINIREKIRIGQADKVSLVDPACGSGTFLYSAAREIIKSSDWTTKDQSKQLEDLITSNVYGLDVAEFPLYLAEMSILMRMLFLIIGKTYNNPLDKKIKVFVTKDSLSEFLGSVIEIPKKSNKQSGLQASYFGRIIQPEYESYMRDEVDLAEMKDSITAFPRRRFDYVVANPPYVSYNECCKQHVTVFNLIKSGKVKLNNIYGVNLHSVPGNPKRYRPNPNLYAFFVALGLALLKDDGRLCYIMPQTLLVNADFDVLRYHLSKFTTIEKIIIFSGKMFIGRGLRQNKPVPTSSLILIASRKTPETEHQTKIVNYSGEDTNIEEVFENISKGINVLTRNIAQTKLLENISNWNFIKADIETNEFLEIYTKNSDDMSLYYTHTSAKYIFNDTFIFDGGYSIDEKKYLSTPDELQGYYQCPKLNNKFWTIKEYFGFWTNERIKGRAMYIALRQGNQGYSFLDAQFKIIWSYNATDRFFYTEKPVIWARNKYLGIASNNRNEILYFFAILNSRVTKFLLNSFVKIAQEDTRTILVSLQIIKNLLRVPKITETNKFIKTILINKVDELLKLENATLSEFVDFSEVLLQKFNGISVEDNELILEHQNSQRRLFIKGDISLIKNSVENWKRSKGRRLEENEIALSEIKELPIINIDMQTKLKGLIDDLVFALYLNIPLDEKEIEMAEYVKNACSISQYYKLCS